MSQPVDKILSWYASESSDLKANLSRLMNHGVLSGTGKFVILPVDQGFEHGPLRSFGKNPEGYDPKYHAQLAVDAGCNAYAAPLGFIEFVAPMFSKKLPLILKVNNSDSLTRGNEPCSAITASVKDAVRLGCTAVGYTIYPGSGERNPQYEALQRLIHDARAAHLPTIVWAYPRGAGISKEGETALDVVGYAAHLSCQLGAHIVKVKPPKDAFEFPETKKIAEGLQLRTDRLSDRVQEVVRSAFNGQRILIFSGGEAKSKEQVLEEVSQIAQGGGFGSIMGRNAFQRPKDEAIQLLHDVMDIYKRS